VYEDRNSSELYIKSQFVFHRKMYVSITKKMEIVAFFLLKSFLINEYATPTAS